MTKSEAGWDGFKRVLFSIMIILVAGWITWVSFSASGNKERISVVEASISYVRSDISEMKALVKEIRQDQVRRERGER